MDAFELLKRDHQKVAELFKKIESASGAAKRELFSELRADLETHARVEENIFYPALENKEEAREITLEAYEEHKVVKDLLAELSDGNGSDEGWDAKLTVLRENVEHHVEEEEGELFRKARQALSRQQIETLGAEMEAEKAGQQPAKARTAVNKKPAGKRPSTKRARTSKSPGVLQRIASLVGLGGSSSDSKRSAKSAAKKKRGAAAGKAASSKTASRNTAGGKRRAATTKASAKSSKSSRGSAAANKKRSGKKSPSRKGAKKSAKKNARRTR